MYSKYLIDLGLKDWIEEDNHEFTKTRKSKYITRISST